LHRNTTSNSGAVSGWTFSSWRFAPTSADTGACRPPCKAHGSPPARSKILARSTSCAAMRGYERELSSPAGSPHRARPSHAHAGPGLPELRLRMHRLIVGVDAGSVGDDSDRSSCDHGSDDGHESSRSCSDRVRWHARGPAHVRAAEVSPRQRRLRLRAPAHEQPRTGRVSIERLAAESKAYASASGCSQGRSSTATKQLHAYLTALETEATRVSQGLLVIFRLDEGPIDDTPLTTYARRFRIHSLKSPKIDIARSKTSGRASSGDRLHHGGADLRSRGKGRRLSGEERREARAFARRRG
jgi:hypothetical protein